MKLYFGNTTTTITTLMILCLLGFIGYTIFQRANILYWGRRTLFVLVFGLVICCFAAARDGLDKTIHPHPRQSLIQKLREDAMFVIIVPVTFQQMIEQL